METEEVKERFFRTGRAHIDEIMGTADDIFGGPGQSVAALDFGCGVGRLLSPLAERFDTVIAIDISSRMLELAMKNNSAYGNIMFHRSLDEVGQLLDFVHSFITLQHVRPAQGMLIIEKIMCLLRPGGMFALHVTTGDSWPVRAAANWMRYRFPAFHWCYNLARRRPLAEPIAEMNKYVPFEILELAKRNGFKGAFAQSIDHNGHQGIIFFAKKS